MANVLDSRGIEYFSHSRKFNEQCWSKYFTLPSCVHTQEYLPVVQAAIVVMIPKNLEQRKTCFYESLSLNQF